MELDTTTYEYDAVTLLHTNWNDDFCSAVIRTKKAQGWELCGHDSAVVAERNDSDYRDDSVVMYKFRRPRLTDQTLV